MKRFIFIICLILIIYESSLTVPTLKAQPYPNRPIQLIVPIEAGTPADINSRLLAEELKKILKVQIVVINKPGASMAVGTDFVVKSKKDGYTILYAPATGITYVRAIQPETVPYDPMKDLEPLGLHMFFAVGIAVLESAPWKTFAEFVDYAKENPGKIRISTPGIQTTSSFNIVIIENLTGAQFTQVPFKGTPAINAVLGGHVEAVVFAFSGLVPHANSGKIRILLTSKKMSEYPHVPMIGELGYKEELPSPWLALYAPAGVPDEVKNVLVPALKKAINDPELIAKINKIAGSIVDYKSPGELTKLMIEEDKTISAIAVKIGLRK